MSASPRFNPLFLAGALLAAPLWPGATLLQAAPGQTFPELTAVEKAAVRAALPAKARVEPRQPRRLLVFYRTEGFVHKSIPIGNEALRLLGETTGAYTAVVSDDMAMFSAESLAKFDAVVFANTTKLAFADPAHRQALLAFVAAGKGVAGIHAATDNFPTWPEGQALIGGLFHNHPWNAGDTVAVKLDEPAHPLNRSFGGQGFWVKEEIYQHKAPYSRETQRVLLSLDMSRPENARPAGKLARDDQDFAISWLRSAGAGRVFYTSLGHNNDIFATPVLLQHLLDGLQYALGDLPADATPSARLKELPKPALAPESAVTVQALAAKALPAVAALAAQRPPAATAPSAAATTPAAAAKPTTAAEVIPLLAAVSAHVEGKNAASLRAFEQALRLLPAAQRSEVETAILPLLSASAPSVTAEGKRQLLGALGWIGSARAVPTLEKLGASELAPEVAVALAGVPGPEAEAALGRLVAQGTAAARLDFLQALGQRISTGVGAPSSTSAATLAVLVGAAADPALQGAALAALGQVGSVDSLQALAKLAAAQPTSPALAQAQLAAADRVLHPWQVVTSSGTAVAGGAGPATTGKPVASPAIQLALTQLRTLTAQAPTPSLRLGAALTLAAADPAADAELVKLLTYKELLIRTGVARGLVRAARAETTQRLAAGWAAYPPDVQLVLAQTVAEVSVPVLAPLAAVAFTSKVDEVRLAGIEALGRTGNLGAVDQLYTLLLTAVEPERAAVLTALTALPVTEVDAALRARLEQETAPASQALLLRILGERQDRGSFALATARCARPEAPLRLAAFTAVARLVQVGDLAAVMALAPQVQASAERREWRKALQATAAVHPDSAEATRLLASALTTAATANRPVLIDALSNTPGDEARQSLRGLLAAPEVEARKEITRALASARNLNACALLADVAAQAPTEDERLLALRGYLETIAALELKDDKALVEYRRAWPLTTRDEERNTIRDAVGRMRKNKDTDKFLQEMAAPAPATTAQAGTKSTT